MRVALVCQHFHPYGGVARDAYLFARQLVELGVEIDCYGNPRTSVPAPGVTFHPVDVPRFAIRHRLSVPLEHTMFVRRAAEAIRRRRTDFDVVYAIGAEALEPDVSRVHAVVKAENRRWPSRGGRHFKYAGLKARLMPLTGPQNALERTIQKHQFKAGSFRRFVAVTDEVKLDLHDYYSVPLESVDVVPCPIDIESISDAPSAEIRRALNLHPDDTILLFLGNHFYRKGLDEALRVLSFLPASSHLMVVGSGDPSPFDSQARNLGLADRVHFAGHSQRPESYLKDADILFLPTREDVWGIALIEAMAAGVPVVTTSVAGASRVVSAAGAGVVLDGFETSAFVHALSPLLNSPSRRHELGDRGRQAAEAFDIRRLAPSLLATLERAAGQG
jgi:glycosyltransferase involved in cell wall biosynthesis